MWPPVSGRLLLFCALLHQASKSDLTDSVAALYVLARDSQRLSGPHQPRCELHAALKHSGVTRGRVNAPFASMLKNVLYV